MNASKNKEVMLDENSFIRVEIRNNVRGKIYLCLGCKKEMFKTPYYFRNSSGYCSPCASKKVNTKVKRILTEKKCISCEKVLDISYFSLTGSGHIRSKCIKCSNLKTAFNLSYKSYEELLIKQNNKCAICNREETAKGSKGKIRNLAIDHNHSTGKIRGLLCTNCNTAIGQFKDNKELLIQAIKYLEEYEDKN